MRLHCASTNLDSWSCIAKDVSVGNFSCGAGTGTIPWLLAIAANAGHGTAIAGSAGASARRSANMKRRKRAVCGRRRLFRVLSMLIKLIHVVPSCWSLTRYLRVLPELTRRAL